MQFKQIGSNVRANQSGFTLIELIVVIVILGILAATALPRFADMGDNARFAKMQAARGAVQSAMNIAHGEALVVGGTPATISMEGTDNVAMAFNYPTAAAIATAAGLGTDYTVTVAAGVATIADNSVAACRFTYTQATNATTPPAVTTPALGSC
ncbi:type II secretion system protein [Pseudoduganella armeniaca]|jgi:MSHA pilin protein MshA|uniref:Prepilin-type cleavage/methylation domain-containing protein n=1 Tax=Pseudoduganella armeniaca TaxID=2072590 RepID=A0A2R4CAU8_9BURK|nr:type II secretion system protein [Pseudoduganella armeniaca]AVR96682.1 prepilin-type cleavage/methylation domain-containing protein [Pseudoduganella armeniaca]